MKDFGFFLGFFLLIAFLAIVTAGGNGIFSNMATSTSLSGTSGRQETTQSVSNLSTGSSQTVISAPAEPKLTNDQIERKVADIYQKLDQLSEQLRAQKLREPVSPYVGQADLRLGNARDTNPEREYLTLSAPSSNKTNINISDWYVESYVTEERAAIPQGDRILEKWRRPKQSNILLEPGETAYLMTGESPINTSFHENMCTGYLASEAEFYPSLSSSCPAPNDEMKRFADIALDNDACYNFIERISRCTTIFDDTPGYETVNGVCRKLLDTTLNHESCVKNHRYDPFFDNVGYWHVYFERDEELWRPKREIIRLMDENDRVIDVVEY